MFLETGMMRTEEHLTKPFFMGSRRKALLVPLNFWWMFARNKADFPTARHFCFVVGLLLLRLPPRIPLGVNAPKHGPEAPLLISPAEAEAAF